MVLARLIAFLIDYVVLGFYGAAVFGIAISLGWDERISSPLVGQLTGFISLTWKEARSLAGFSFLTLAMASHGLLDTLTDGGLGAALWWPFDNSRIFAPETPIRVSPIGAGFFSMRGLETLISEFKWIWLPCLSLAILGWMTRRATSPQP